MERFPLVATASRGTEPIVAEELTKLGARRVRQDRGGVRCMADLEEATRFCVESRVAMRLLLPLGEWDAPGREGLYEAARAVPWEDWLTAETTFAVEASTKNTEHRHTGFVALCIKDGLVDRLRERLGARPNVDSQEPCFRIVAHLTGARLRLSLDLCGSPLAQRGYRVAPVVASMKETLAAAMLVASGYTGEEPFADPLCGAGTLAIEAALIATRRSPGSSRKFAFERWPRFAKTAVPYLAAARGAARARVRAAPCPIIARDYDTEAIQSVHRNAATAGVKQLLTIEEADVFEAGPPSVPPGLLVTNPPYGERLGNGQKGMKTFYYRLSETLGAWTGWRLAVLAGNRSFEGAFHRQPSARRELWNGPLACELLEYGGTSTAAPSTASASRRKPGFPRPPPRSR